MYSRRTITHSLLFQMTLLAALFVSNVFPLVAHGQQSVPNIKDLEVTATVSFDSPTFTFTYAYAVSSASTNTGNVRDIDIDITTDLTRTFFIKSPIPEYKGVVLERLDEKGINILPVETTAPAGWDSVNLTALGTANWGGTLGPGQSVGGFVLTSTFVLGIRTVTVSPDISTWDLYPDAGDPEDVKAQQHALIKNLDFVGPTVGPVGVVPGSFAHWNQLRDDLNRAIQIGWITNAALGATLVAQLTDAREALEQLSGATAKERLQIVLDTLAQAAAGDLRSEARDLIRLNAEVLIARTPNTPVRFEPKLSLIPEVTELAIGGAYTLNAKLVNVADLNRPVADFQLNFQVLDGPHEGKAASVDTDTNGEASFGFIGTKLGPDKIEVLDRSLERVLGKARVAWTGGPDLVVPLFVPPFIESKGGNTFFITDTTANIGSMLAGPSTTGFFLSETPPPFDIGTARFIGERAVPQLAPNEKSRVQEIAFTIPTDLPPGTYHLVGCADARLAVVELDEDNNCSFNPVAVLPSVVVGVRPVLNNPPTTDCALLAVEDHGDDDTEFLIQATGADAEDGVLTPTVRLLAIAEDGSETLAAELNNGDRIRLRVNRDRVKVERAAGADLVDNEFQVRSEASKFKVLCSITDSGGLTAEDAVIVDLGVTAPIHEAKPDVSELPILVN